MMAFIKEVVDLNRWADSQVTAYAHWRKERVEKNSDWVYQHVVKPGMGTADVVDGKIQGSRDAVWNWIHRKRNEGKPLSPEDQVIEKVLEGEVYGNWWAITEVGVILNDLVGRTGESLNPRAGPGAIVRDVLRVASVVPVGRVLRAMPYLGPWVEAGSVELRRISATVVSDLAEWAVKRKIGPAGMRQALEEMIYLNNTGGICGPWSVAKALRLTGIKPFARLADVFDMAGISPLERARFLNGAGAQDMLRLGQGLTQTGADVETSYTISSMQELEALARQNPGGVVVFGVEWRQALLHGNPIPEQVADRWAQGGLPGLVWKKEGHAMVAKWRPWSGFEIIDRSGVPARTLAELEAKYRGITGALPIRNWPTLVIQRAEAMLGRPGLDQILMLEMAVILEHDGGGAAHMAGLGKRGKPGTPKAAGPAKKPAETPSTGGPGAGGQPAEPPPWEKDYPGMGTSQTFKTAFSTRLEPKEDIRPDQ
jgi:hypothetical protein